MRFCIIIDGPNFINRLLEHGVSKEYILNVFSLFKFAENIKGILKTKGLEFQLFPGIDFYCSKKNLSQLNQQETDKLLDKFRKETGVTVHRISLKTDKEEKGVDSSVITRMFEVQNFYETVVLVASDKDYVPTIELLRTWGKYVITVGYSDKTHPTELINFSYLFLDINDIFASAKKKKPLVIEKTKQTKS